MAASCSRARASTVTASTSTPRTSQSAVPALLSASSLQTRSQSAGMSVRAIGPWIENASVLGDGEAMLE